MSDYDVIVIGGGINGLTAAAYLGRAGLKTLVLEARGECGAHCDTTEPGIPGFLHNLHATWLITAMSPAMGDLELYKHGLEFRVTDFIYGKTFKDGKNCLQGVFPINTVRSWERHSAKDVQIILKAGELLLTNLEPIKALLHDYLFRPPSVEIEKSLTDLLGQLYAKMGINISGEAMWNMDGFQIGDLLYESEHIKTTIQTLGWIGALPPIHPKIGALGTALLGPLTGAIYPVHQAKGGSHAVTHALVKAAKTYGVKILPCCPVDKILVENGSVVGVKLSEHAVYPGEVITTRKIISNLTLTPTFMNLLGEDAIGAEWAGKISRFDYNEQNLFGVYYALDGPPQFASADYDPGIQKCFMGYFGGDNGKALKRFNQDLVNGVIHDEICANWFVPTLADPTQAPPGCHTSFAWLDTPPAPKRWKHGPLEGLKSWDKIKLQMADIVTDTYEQYAPGFKKLIRDRIIYTPLDMQKNNPSAVHGNWVGGSVIPEQFYFNRPLPGIMQKGSATRTFMTNLHMSNSIHPFGATWLASGYLAAGEVAEDLGVREQPWWKDKACMWYIDNMNKIPTNLGVR